MWSREGKSSEAEDLVGWEHCHIVNDAHGGRRQILIGLSGQQDFITRASSKGWVGGIREVGGVVFWDAYLVGMTASKVWEYAKVLGEMGFEIRKVGKWWRNQEDEAHRDLFSS